MPETHEEKILRIQGVLQQRFESFKTAFLPYRDLYEEAAPGEFFAGNQPDSGLEGLLFNIQELINPGNLHRYDRRQISQTIDYLKLVREGKKTISQWAGSVESKITRLADWIARYLGTTYSLSERITPDGFRVVYTYNLVPPPNNEFALRFQAALNEALGYAWPLKPEDQLRRMGFQIQMRENAIKTWTQAIQANPGAADIFEANIERESQELARLLEWRDYIERQELPGDQSPVSVLTHSPQDVVEAPSIDESSPVVRATEKQIKTQSPDVVDETAKSKDYFAEREQDLTDIRTLTGSKNPIEAIKTAPDSPDPVKSVAVDSPVDTDTLPADKPSTGVLGVPSGDIPAPANPIDPRLLSVPAESTFFDEVNAFSDGMVDQFDSFNDEITFTAGPGPVFEQKNTDANAEASSALEDGSDKRKLLLAAVISAFILKAF